MPGFGLRQSQLSAPACGQKKMASISAPTCCARVCIFWWIAFSTVMSKYSRALPDWFEALTTR
ncbi:hypothetical protein D3C72_2346300 [compost metagenome]